MHFLDRFGAPAGATLTQRVAGRVVTCGLFFFALAVPHSIAGAHIGLNLALLGWIIRDLAARELHFKRTPIDRPLLGFVALTMLSAVFPSNHNSVCRRSSPCSFSASFIFVPRICRDAGSACSSDC